MSDRDRNIAIGAAVVFGVLLLYYGLSTWLDSSTRLAADIDKQAKANAAQKAIIDNGHRATARIEAAKTSSLPGERDVARAAYQAWLVKQAQTVGLSDINVSPGSGREQSNVYYQLSFTLGGRGNLRQFTELLHRFYSLDLLHRMKRVSVKPITNTKDLELVLSIEALVMKDAEKTPGLVERPGDRLRHEAIEPYVESIVNRNIFAPANNPPKLARIGSQKATRGDSVTFTAKATDIDPLDKLRYVLDPGAPEGAQIDPTSGKFSFRPKASGTFPVTIRALDDGYPSLAAVETVQISVSDPPPPRPMVAVRPSGPPPAPTPKLDQGKFAYVTALNEVGGKPELWLSIRSTGELMRLYEGDNFEIGGLRAKIHEITDTEVVLVTAGRTFRVKLGDNLSQATEDPRDGL